MATNEETRELVAQALKRADRSEKWTADQAGIAYPTFRRRLRGDKDFTVSEVARIAHALQIKPSDLLPAQFRIDEAA
mgnify:CR=1 FL=1